MQDKTSSSVLMTIHPIGILPKATSTCRLQGSLYLLSCNIAALSCLLVIFLIHQFILYRSHTYTELKAIFRNLLQFTPVSSYVSQCKEALLCRSHMQYELQVIRVYLHHFPQQKSELKNNQFAAQNLNTDSCMKTLFKSVVSCP